MSKKALKMWIAAISVTMTFHASAALQSVHWKVAGDNLATLDTLTGIEWLDLTQTDNKSYNQVQEMLNTTHVGWRFPTAQEVHTMMVNQFPILSNSENSSYNVRTNTSEGPSREPLAGREFRAAFGHTYTYYQSGSDWSYASWGLFKGDDGLTDVSGWHRRNYWNGSYQRLVHNESQTLLDSASNVNQGWYLVSDGGLTLSSNLDPTINANNPAAPINQPPAGHIAVESIVAGTDYATINLSYTPAGVSSVVGYKYKINGGAEQVTSGTILNLVGLNPGTMYNIEYAAYNNGGTGTWYSTQVPTQQVTSVSTPMSIAGLSLMLLGFGMRRKVSDI